MATKSTRPRKEKVLAGLNELLAKGKVAIVTDLTGFTVAEITQFRRRLDKANARCRIAKNTLIRIAAGEGQFAALKEMAQGPTALVIGLEDPVTPAKATSEFFKSLKKGTIRGGVLEGRPLTPEQVKGLADLPSREQLLSSIMGGLDSGARGIAGILEAVIRDIAILAEEVAKKKAA